MLFYPGPGPLTLLCTLRRTHPGEKEEEKGKEKKERKTNKERKKRKSVPSSSVWF